MKPPDPVLRARDYTVEPIGRPMALDLVRAFHYAAGGANTATACHGLFRRDDPMTCLGAAWWLPPTRAAAQAVWPRWQGVLVLSRLVLDPEVPTNGASFLLSRSVRLLRADPRWECLLTYADEAQGHDGTIYRAAGWEYLGRTASEPLFRDAAGVMVARKSGPVTRTVEQMRDLGHVLVGRSRKHRFRLVIAHPSLQSGVTGSTFPATG